MTLGRYAYVANSSSSFGSATQRLVIGSATRVVGTDAFVDSARFATAERAIARQAQCESCHGTISWHAERFDELEQCAACHQPGIRSSIGDAGLALDGLMHRIHAGAALPSVIAGAPVTFVTDAGVRDYSTVVFPRSLEHCAACHTETAPGDAWKRRPSVEACTTCHDRTTFVTPVPSGFTAHAPATNSQCAICHSPTVLEGQHSDPSFDGGFPALELTVISVSNSGPLQSPAVTFRLTSGGSSYDLLNDSLTLLRMALVGPNTEFGTPLVATAQGVGATGVLTAVDQPNGLFRYQFLFTLPPIADGSYTVFADGYLTVGTERAVVRSTPFAFAVTDPTPVPRRAIIEPAKCDGCHLSLVAHGSTRGAAGCPVCHTASLDNSTRVRRFEDESVQAETTDFKVMIHKLHRGEHLSQPYVLYGFPAPSKANPLGTPRDFGAVRSPRSTADCDSCHVSPQTWALPLGPLAPTTQRTWDCIEDASADTDSYCDQRVLSATSSTPPESAVCTSCHDQPWVVAHAQINTSLAGVESCTTCHGPGAQARAH